MDCKYTCLLHKKATKYCARRWIRLLFGREFDIYDLLKLWDAIFAQDPSLEIVEYICLVMLLRMRDQCKYMQSLSIFEFY